MVGPHCGRTIIIIVCNNSGCPVLEPLQMLNFCSTAATPYRTAVKKTWFCYLLYRVVMAAMGVSFEMF